MREDLADYLGEIAAFDAGLGILIDELKKRGEYENTLIVVSGDHGRRAFPMVSVICMILEQSMSGNSRSGSQRRTGRG